MQDNYKRVPLDSKYMKEVLFKRIVGEMIGKNTNQSPELTGEVCSRVGVTFESQSHILNETPASVMGSLTKAMMETVNNLVDNYVIEHTGVLWTHLDGVVAQEAAVDEIVKDTEGDALGSTLADMIMDLAERTSTQIKDMSKYVLRLVKQNQEEKKEELLEENEEIENENADDGQDPFAEDGGDDGSQSNAEDDGTSDTGFGEGDDTAGNAFDDGASGDGNPFDDNASEGEGETDTQEDGNPFDSEDGNNEGQDNGGGEANPFESESTDNSGEQQETPTDKTDNKEMNANTNPFESVHSLSDFKLPNGKRPFIGLEAQNLTEFVIANTKPLFEKNMREVFESNGMESVEYQTLLKQFSKANKLTLEATVSVLGYCALLGFKPNLDDIRYPDLYAFKREELN